MRIKGSLEDRLRGKFRLSNGGLKTAIASISCPALYLDSIFIQGLNRQADKVVDSLSFLTHKEALAYYNKVVATLEAWSKYCEELKDEYRYF
jgi:hypothetical protein